MTDLVIVENGSGVIQVVETSATPTIIEVVTEGPQGIPGSMSVNGVEPVDGNVTLTKNDLGLSNVENKSSATIRGEITSGNVTGALGFVPLPNSYVPSWGVITGIPTFSTVAISGSYNDLSDKPASYSLPTSSTAILGGVKVDGVSIGIAGGVISTSAASIGLTASEGAGLVGFLTSVEYAANTVGAWLKGLATSAGSELIGFLQSGSGAVLTTLQAKLQDSVSVLDFMTDAQRADVKSGAMTLDVVGAFSAALATGRPVFVPSGIGWIYKISAAISVPSNSVIFGNRSKIFLANGANNHVIRIANGASNIEIKGLHLDGNKDNNSGSFGIATGGAGCWGICIEDNYIKNCAVSGISCIGTDVYDVKIKNNIVESCNADGIVFSASSSCTRIDIKGNKTFSNGTAGISGNNTSSKVKMDGNFSWLNGTHGIGFIGICIDSEITNNVAWDNGQGDPTADNITAYNSSINNLLVANNVTKGGLNNGIHVGGNLVVVTNNTVTNATQYGIALLAKNSSGDVVEMTDFALSNNVVKSCGLSGYWLYKTSFGSVTGNVSRGNTGHGIATDEVSFTTFNGNTLAGNAQCGYRNETASLANIYSNNIAASNTGHGFELKNVTVSSVSGNNCRSNGGFGITGGGTAGANNIVANITRLNTAGHINTMPSNTRIADNDLGASRSVASATTITLPVGGDYFYITGTTNITSITGSWTERRVTLQFDDVLTVTDGGNLNMAGNFVTAWKATISYIFDGTNWVETSRSLN